MKPCLPLPPELVMLGFVLEDIEPGIPPVLYIYRRHAGHHYDIAVFAYSDHYNASIANRRRRKFYSDEELLAAVIKWIEEL